MLATERAQMDSARREKHKEYVQAKADLELGLSGVRKALGLLRDYYGRAAAMLQQPAAPEYHEKAEGTGSPSSYSRVCESDSATNLQRRRPQNPMPSQPTAR